MGPRLIINSTVAKLLELPDNNPSASIFGQESSSGTGHFSFGAKPLTSRAESLTSGAGQITPRVGSTTSVVGPFQSDPERPEQSTSAGVRSPNGTFSSISASSVMTSHKVKAIIIIKIILFNFKKKPTCLFPLPEIN